MKEESWRSPTEAERELVKAWTRAWDEEPGAATIVDDELLVRGSCSCGTCPSFQARPLLVDPPPAGRHKLAVEGEAESTDGTVAAGLIAWRLDDRIVDFEIYWQLGEPVALEQLAFTFINLAT